MDTTGRLQVSNIAASCMTLKNIHGRLYFVKNTHLASHSWTRVYTFKTFVKIFTKTCLTLTELTRVVQCGKFVTVPVTNKVP